jgi:tetratricopeptide (TPR) repeat protein
VFRDKSVSNLEFIARLGGMPLSRYTYFSQALEIERTQPYLVNRGDCLREQGKIELCITDYMEALQLTNENGIVLTPDKDLRIRVAVAFNEVGMELFQRHQYVQAFEYFSQCVQQLPDVRDFGGRCQRSATFVARIPLFLLLIYAHCRIQHGRRGRPAGWTDRKALNSVFEQVLEYRINRFHAADSCGQLRVAVEDLKAAVALDPNHSYCRSRLAEWGEEC